MMRIYGNINGWFIVPETKEIRRYETTTEGGKKEKEERGGGEGRE